METILCPKCKGTGRAKVRPMLQVCLDYIKASGEATAGQVGRALGGNSGYSPALWNRRLEILRAYGFLERRRDRNGWHYSLKPQ
jgi:hypothetical protein